MKRTAVILIMICALFLIALGGCVEETQTPTTADLARCLTDKGAKMYGAEWCGHCQNQKAMFSDAFQYIDYIECPEEREACTEAGITAYPTWIIGGEQYVGEQSFEGLATLSGCFLI